MKKLPSDDNTSMSAINFSIKNPSKEPSVVIIQSENEKTDKSSKNESTPVS
jgi:U4/U6.U5 small nuclear ribonucleoproteins